MWHGSKVQIKFLAMRELHRTSPSAVRSNGGYGHELCSIQCLFNFVVPVNIFHIVILPHWYADGPAGGSRWAMASIHSEKKSKEKAASQHIRLIGSGQKPNKSAQQS